VPVIHIKDKEMAGNDPVMAPIGEGNLDWDSLIPACEAPVSIGTASSRTFAAATPSTASRAASIISARR
jgi:sugar phosphate isomerase/epimerase